MDQASCHAGCMFGTAAVTAPPVPQRNYATQTNDDLLYTPTGFETSISGSESLKITCSLSQSDQCNRPK